MLEGIKMELEIFEEDKELNELLQRPNSPELNNILGKKIKVLDHGFVRVIDYMGDDNSIVQAARVSYGKGTKKKSEDSALINYLLKHKHTTPFEMCEIKFHVKMPIFIARQWIRHRTANVNEYSARYSIAIDDYYLPNTSEISPQSVWNKQCRDEGVNFIESDALKIQDKIKESSDKSYETYLSLLNCDSDYASGQKPIDPSKPQVARELARSVLSLNHYTEMYWKIDLHNLLHFLNLRSHKHAQYEIRVYAIAMLDLVKLWVPVTYNAFIDHVKNSVNISQKLIEVAKKKISGQEVTQENSGLSKREWNEFVSIFCRDE